MLDIYVGKGAGRYIIPQIENSKRRIWICSPLIDPEYANLLVRKAHEGVDVRVITSSSSNNIHSLRILKGDTNRETAPRKFNSTALLYALCVALTPLLIPIYYAYKLSRKLKLQVRTYTIDTSIALSLFVTMFLLYVHSFYIGAKMPDIYYKTLTVTMAVLPVIYMIITYFKTIHVKAMEQAAQYTVKNLNIVLTTYPKDVQINTKIYIIDNIAILSSANLTNEDMWHNIEHVIVFTEEDKVRKIEQEFQKLLTLEGYQQCQ